ncbi:MAG: hypothetical protein CMJ83_14485 [Planctomycetes bacterium]|nr:hypothetical protein [Planctomycetota bacterium]
MTDTNDEPLIEGVDLPTDALRLPEGGSMRTRVLLGSQPVLRRRRILRRALAVVTAGLLVSGGWFGHDVIATIPAGGKDAPSDSAPPGPDEVRASYPTDPVLIEARAEDPTSIDRARLYREAGDRYLSDLGDVRGALRCYTRHFELGGAVTPNLNVDTWLLASLRRTAQ